MDLWKDLDKITTVFKRSPVKILMLDFDGTLAPIVQSPKEAKLSIETKDLLEKLCQKSNLYLAIVSGRELEDIKKKIGLPDIIYGGNHGLEGEIFGRQYRFFIPKKILTTLKKIRLQLGKIAEQFDGVFIEDKRIVLSFHYRLVDKQQISIVKTLFKKALASFVKKKLVTIVTGKEVFDIRPGVNCNKGTFAKLVIDKIRTKTKNKPAVVFIGDDITDEDVFQTLEDGITIRVGGGRQSNAKYNLKNTKEVFKFLEWVAISF